MNTTATITKQPVVSASRKKKSTLKARLSMLALTTSLAAASQAEAQMYEQVGPLGSVGWRMVPTLCQVLPNCAASTFNYVLGTVAFANTSYGTIGEGDQLIRQREG